MDAYEQQTQNEYGKLINRDRELDRAIEGLELALAENEAYKALVKLKEEKEHLFDDFKANRLKEFEKRKIKTIDGMYGKITMRENISYKVVDEKQVPQEFFKQSVDMDAVKKQFLLKKTVPGVERKVSHSLLLTPKREGESS